jgi:hypothetical protein
MAKRSGAHVGGPEKRYSIENRAGKAAHLASWRKMTQPDDFCWCW